MSDNTMRSRQFSVPVAFGAASQWISYQCGRPTTFAIACATVFAWAVTGPYFQYSDTWQLVINTGTTIVTFLMVFLIQNTQNRDMAILQLKLDELIRVNQGARNTLLGLENLTEDELSLIKGTFARLAGHPSDIALLQEASDELDEVAEDIQEAKNKVQALQTASAAEPPDRRQ